MLDHFGKILPKLLISYLFIIIEFKDLLRVFRSVLRHHSMSVDDATAYVLWSLFLGAPFPYKVLIYYFAPLGKSGL